MALAPEGLEGQNVKMGKAKSVRNFAFLSPVLPKLDGVLLFFRLFGAVVIYMPCCVPETLTSVIFFTAMRVWIKCCFFATRYSA